MSPKRFALLVLRDTTIWIAIAINQALSRDEAEEMAAEEAEMAATLEERLKGWEIN